MKMDWLSQDISQAVQNLDLKILVPSVPEVSDLLSQTVLFRGKKLRPILCFLMGKFFRIPTEEMAPYARAAEWVHASTLAHDDVIDESLVRRSRPTLNARASNAHAVLAGDLLLSRVMVELSRLGKLNIIHHLSLAIEALVEGEWLQLEARGKMVDRIHLETVALKKTASLMVWCCGVAPWILADQEALPHLEILKEAAQGYGQYLGVAFQMVDDVIDYQKNAEKPFAQDLREGIVNFVTLELVELFPHLKKPIQALLGQEMPKGEVAFYPWAPEELQKACDQVRSRALAKLRGAEEMLRVLSQSFPQREPQAFQALEGILEAFRERTH